MNWKGQKAVFVAYSELLSWNLLGATMENHQKPLLSLEDRGSRSV